MSLGLVKISTPRFGRAVPATDWESILREERVSRLVGNRIRIVRDANNQVWQETTFESNGRITDRAYARPIAPDILILLRLNFREQVSQGQRANALMIQEAMLSTVTIEPVNTSSGPQMQGKKPSQSRNP
jgi:hypothetical protein